MGSASDSEKLENQSQRIKMIPFSVRFCIGINNQLIRRLIPAATMVSSYRVKEQICERREINAAFFKNIIVLHS